VFGHYSEALFYIAAGMFMLSSTETLALQLTRPHVDEHMGSILVALLKDRSRLQRADRENKTTLKRLQNTGETPG
jgi:hypothetical protein